jgi:nitrogen fixation protein NifU and related proteins
VYGPTAEEHLKQPRNLGRIEEPDGVGTVEEPTTDTVVTVYVRLGKNQLGHTIVAEARFRAFGCGACIIAGSVATEIVTDLGVTEASRIDAEAILEALDNGLPDDQRYCADLVARALNLALASCK